MRETLRPQLLGPSASSYLYKPTCSETDKTCIIDIGPKYVRIPTLQMLACFSIYTNLAEIPHTNAEVRCTGPDKTYCI